MKLSFAEAITESEIIEQAQPLAKVEFGSELTVDVASKPTLGKIEGELNRSDVRLPYLAVANSGGKLVDESKFSPGAIVLNSELELPPPVEFVVLGAKKLFTENVEFGCAGQTFESIAEVKRAGGTVDWVNNQPPTFIPVGVFTVAVKKQNNIDDLLFPYVAPDNSLWGLAQIHVRKSGYKTFAVPIFSLCELGALRTGLHNGLFRLVSEKKTYEKKTWYVPTVKMAGKNSPEMVEFFKTIYS